MTQCTGAQADGLTIAANPATVDISEGARLSSSSAAALLVAQQGAGYPDNTSAIVSIGGEVKGIGQNGIEFRSSETLGVGGRLNLSVDAGGSVTGTNGIALTTSSTNPNASMSLVVENRGVIEGIGGYAIDAGTNPNTYLIVTNRATGSIGSIRGHLRFYNEGLIDGGLGSAVDGLNSGLGGPEGLLDNSGVITARGNAATLTGIGVNYGLVNSGTISNSGTGAAISGSGIKLNNNAGGVINGDIHLSDALVLDNKGVINGDVRVDTPPALYMPNSSIDSTEGIINGNLTLGAGHDQIHATIKDGRFFTGITGTIDGGAGNDGIILDIKQNSTIAVSTILPGFDYLNVATTTGTTTTLADGFVSRGPLSFSGSGSVINQTSLVANGYLGIQIADSYSYNVIFSNRGTITGNSFENSGFGNGTGAAVQLYGATFDNSGTITIAGNALNAGGNVRFTNSGTITATGTAVRLDWGTFSNSGTIRSTGGTALSIDTSDYVIRQNSGTIDGAATGVALQGGVLRNSGLISSAGIAVAPMGGTLYNDVGGTIRGGAMAIGPRAGTPGVYASTIINAGTIEGNVDLSGGSSQASYIALKGGMLNGNLTLGASDLFVTDFAARFASVSGTIAANGAALRYLVTSDASSTLGAEAGFGAVSYEVAAGSTLTLGASSPRTDSLNLGGHGTVVLNADFQMADKAAIAVAAPLQLPGTDSSVSDLLIVSNGDIGGTRTFYPSGSTTSLIALGNAGRFTNKGTITYSAFGDGTLTAIGGAYYGNGAVTNDGAITLKTATAISGVASIVNNGTIVGDATSRGVSADSVVNSGSMKVGQEAVTRGSSWSTKLLNTGTIESSASTAVSGEFFTIQNNANGSIRGGNGTAILARGGAITNSGVIAGTVNLAYNPYGGSTYGSSYVAQGGTVQGDLLFGRGDDLFLLKAGAALGVSGVIDGGAGMNTFGQEYAGTTTVTVDAPITGMQNFQQRLTVASGPQANVTLVSGTPLTGDVMVYGDGGIVNRAATTGAVATYSSTVGIGTSIGDMILRSFANEVDVGGVRIQAHSFSNSAVIGADRSSPFLSNSLYLSARDVLDFSNSGRIVGIPQNYAAARLNATDLTFMTANNSGSIDGGLAIGLRYLEGASTGAVDVRNSGAIMAGGTSVALDITVARDGGQGSVAVNNSGTIDGGAMGLAVRNAPQYLPIIGSVYSPVGSQAAMEPNSISSVSVINSGAITTSGDGVRTSSYDGTETYVSPAFTLLSSSGARLMLENKAGGLIAADGRDSVAIAAGALSLTNDGIIRGGTGADATYAHYAAAVQTYAANDMIRNNGTIIGSVDLGAGNDIFANYGTLKGNVSLGAGDDIFIQSLLATIDGTVDGGEGADTLVFDITGASFAVDDALRAKFLNFEVEKIIGTGTVITREQVIVSSGGSLVLDTGSDIDVGTGRTAISGSGVTVTNKGSIVGNVDLGGNNNVLVNQGLIFGAVTLGDGGNSMSNSGTVAGPITFGNGANQLLLTGAWTIGGEVNGGAGHDMVGVTFHNEGGDQMVDLTGFRSIEQLAVNGGTGRVTGIGAFQEIDVNAGRLIGQAGSRLFGNVNVFSGATFGSAGTVTGNISVANGATLSPGASPAIMTINGNVRLATGSKTVFEFVPVGQSDQLIVNGNVSIASGAAITLTGSLPPGASRDLIVVNSGALSGKFDAVGRDPGIGGALRYSSNLLQLVGTFVTPAGATVQQGAAIGYVNGLLVTGQASDALLGAVPLLTSGDTANAAVFGRLTPEAYATAAQLGVEQGLGIAKATRRGTAGTTRAEAALYTFAEGLGDWRTLKGDASGVSRATSDTFGMLGGIGYGTDHGSISAFVGYADSRQRIGDLGVRTMAHGVVAGLSAHVESQGFDVTATVAHDWSKAKTQRTLPTGADADARYGLNSLIIDTSIGYAIPVGVSWALRPEAGFTHIMTRRGNVRETGGGAFALAVDHGRLRASFVDGSIFLEGGRANGARLHPWLQGGFRYQLDGARPNATAGFLGTTSSFTVAGAKRECWMGTTGAGLSVDVAPRLHLHGAYRAEIGGSESHNVSVGARFVF